jgi:hypothetical protein
VTVSAELAAVRAVARQMRGTTRPLDPRRLSALASSLDNSVRALDRGIQFLRDEADGTKRTVELGDPEPYDGLELAQALTVLAERCAQLNSVAPDVGVWIAQEVSGLLASDALSQPRSARTPRGVSSTDPGANGRGKARTGARETSVSAAVYAEPGTGTKRRAVLDAVAAVARDPRTAGLTDVEIQRATGISPNSARPRRVELVDGGWLEDSGETREHFGREHTVWVLTERAIHELYAHGLPAAV